MSVIGSNILAGASGQGGGYNLTKSLRFRSSASAYLNRTQTTPTTATKWTYSYWVKRGSLSSYQTMISGTGGGGSGFLFNNDDTIGFYSYSGGYQWNLVTSQVFRDPSAWYHIIVAYDSTQATSSNRVKVYVNGTQVTAFSTATYPSLNTVGFVGGVSGSVRIGLRDDGFYYLDGYLAEMYFVDGQQLTPSSFGETSTSTGVWIPKKYTGTYGTNGFYLPFTNTASTSTLGTDFSGNSNTWTVNNISLTSGVTYDSMNDVPTLTNATTANYAVMNPLNSASSMTPSGGNLNVVTSGVSVTSVSTISVNSGKWYCEITIANMQDSTIVGITPSDRSYISGAFYSVTGGVAYYQDGTKFISGVQTSYGASYTTNDVIGIALDMDAGTVTFYKNNTSQGTAASGLTGGYYFAVGDASSGSNTSYNVNFGQRPFTYTPPTGFVALNTFNLPTPTIGATASTTANKYFDVSLYTGNGSTQSITGVGFQPDWVWLKARSAAFGHGLFDVLRGTTKRLSSDGTGAEGTESGVTAFNSDGFTIGSATFGNNNGTTMVGWQWRANGSGVTNTAGSITSTVSANTTAGFSIVTYTGTGANATVGHGLGVAPSMIMIKCRTGAASNWLVYHQSLSANGSVFLNLTDAYFANSAYWQNTAPTSTVFSIGTAAGLNASTVQIVAYCFAPVAGYSAFGSYVGNGNADGPFIYTGFRPRYYILKNITNAQSWSVQDTSRSPYNVGSAVLLPNSSSAELTGTDFVDILSNGFKIRHSSSGNNNNNGDTYIYMAFAESPFKYANAR